MFASATSCGFLTERVGALIGAFAVNRAPADPWPRASMRECPAQTSRDQTYSVQEAFRKMTVGASLYEPINVYKPIALDIGIVDGPFEYLTVGGVRLPLPFTTRMTVVRLSNDDLFLHSPIKFDEALASELQRIGTIRHLVSPNQFHYAHIGEWSKAFPNAITWASPPRASESARPAHRRHVCARPRPQSACRMAARHRPDTVSRWILQRICFLP